MKTIKLIAIVALAILMASCDSMTKTQKGAVIGTAGGAATGAVVGRAAGNTALGTIIGATVGGVAGAIIGKQMDKQAEEMEKAIPDANVERVAEGIILEMNGKILFGFDQSNLTAEARTNLNKLITILNDYPDTEIEVQGHTDSKGTEAYNQGLSERRANAVSNYLTANGVKSSRLSTKGFGELAPKYTNDTEEGMALNRRVEFLVYANEKMIEDAKKQAGTN